ncbi:MAG: TonB-dependent receptor plug domain-containing protein, partial [bacterium]
MISPRKLLASWALWSLLVSTAALSQPLPTLGAEIAPQPLAQALAAFADQTGLQLVYVSEIVNSKQSKGAHAGLALPVALTSLLEATGLRFEFLNDRTVRIYASVKQTAYRVESEPIRQARTTAATQPLTLAEILVTATRREERLSKVPVSIAAWSREAMEEAGAKTMADIGFLTPTVEYDYFPGFGSGIQSNLGIRGVSARNGTTTGAYLDDTPLPVPGDWGGRFGRAYPVTFDLERVEILRGPQGTLFGQGAMAGAVRFIAAQPSLT